jgi:hypothetical protein
MNIQEFSRQLGREEHSSQLIQALQTLRGLDVHKIPDQPGWAEWPPVEAAAADELPALLS